MYACVRGIWRGYFKGVCTPSNAIANFRDPPPPLSAKEPEPRNWAPARKGLLAALLWAVL
jgi:hypothetical protein